MSISDQGNAAFAWVCRCSSGTCSAPSPRIHILAGENVCIQAITPKQLESAFASSMTRWMASLSVNTGCHCTGSGSCPDSLS